MVSTSRVVVSVTVRSLEQLDIQPSERPTQVASATLVMIFIIGYSDLVEGLRRSRGEERDELRAIVVANLWQTLRAFNKVFSNRCAGKEKPKTNLK